MIDILESEIIGRYDGNGAELEGDSPALRNLAAFLRSVESPPPLTLTVPADASRPDLNYLTAVLIEHEDSSIRIEVKEQLLCLCGSREKLALMAENVERLASAAPHAPHRLNETYIEGHLYLSPSALELVITQKRT